MYDQAFTHFRALPTPEEMDAAHVPEALRDQAPDLVRAWNYRHFGYFMLHDGLELLGIDGQDGMLEIARLEEQFARLVAFERGEEVIFPREDYIDVPAALEAMMPTRPAAMVDADDGDGEDDASEDGAERCTICLKTMGPRPREPPYRLRCNHVIGSDCVRIWFANNDTCPLCRAVQAPPPGTRRDEVSTNLPAETEDARRASVTSDAWLEGTSPYSGVPG